MSHSRFDAIGKRIVIGALMLVQTFCLSPYAPRAIARSIEGGVTINGKTVLVNKASLGFQSAQERTKSIQNNLDNALVAAKGRWPASVHIITVKGNPVITLEGYKIVTVDSSNAELAKTTAPLLAKRWAHAIRKGLADKESMDTYVSQLSGNSTATTVEPQEAPQRPQLQTSNQTNSYPSTQTYGQPNPNHNPSYINGDNPPAQNYSAQQLRGRVTYAPAGVSIPITLPTAISTRVAKPGDMIEGAITENIELEQGQIPAGSIVLGEVTDSEPGIPLERSGSLSIKFNRLRTPDGIETPINAHLVGSIGKRAQKSGAERESDDLLIQSGTRLQIVLDAPLSIAGR